MTTTAQEVLTFQLSDNYSAGTPYSYELVINGQAVVTLTVPAVNSGLQPNGSGYSQISFDVALPAGAISSIEIVSANGLNNNQYVGSASINGVSLGASTWENGDTIEISPAAWDAAVAAGALTPPMPYTLSQNGGTYVTGDYTILNDDWGVPGSGASVSQAYSTASFTAQGAIGNVTFNDVFPDHNPPSNVWNYSEVYWGAYAGALGTYSTTVSNIQHLTVNYSTSIVQAASTDFSDLLIEIYTVKPGGARTEIAVMAYGPSQTGTAYSDSDISGTITSGPITILGQTHEIVSIRTSSDMLTGSIDFAPILQYLEKQGLVSPTDIVSGLELGSETDAGSNTFAINSFNVFETVFTAQAISETGTAPNQFFDISTNNNYVINGGAYGSTATVRINSSATNFTFTEKPSGEIDLSAPGYGSIAITNVSAIQFSDSTITDSAGKLTLNISSAVASSDIDAIQQLVSSKEISSVILTDSGTSTITVTEAQLTNDATALKAIAGAYNLDVVLTQNNQPVTFGDYGLEVINLFSGPADGGATITYGQQTGLGISAATIANNYPTTASPSGGDWGYSNAYWSAWAANATSTTPTVSDIQHLVVNWNTVASGTGNYDQMLDLETLNTAGKADNEISVFINNWSKYGLPAGLQTVTVGGITAYFGTQHEGDSSTYWAANATQESFYLVNNGQTSGTVDYAAILQFLEQKGYVSASDTISGFLSLNTENVSGSNTLVVNSFSVFESLMNPGTVTNTGSANGQTFTVTTNNNYVINGGTYTGDSVAINSSVLNFSITEKASGEVDLSGSAYGSISISNVGTIQFADGSITDANGTLSLGISSASLANGGIDNLEKLISAGQIHSVSLTDGGIPTITVSAAQFTSDAGALKAISGSFNTVINLPSTSTTIQGGLSGLGTAVDINGTSSAYTISVTGDGTDFTVSGNGATYHLSGVTQVQFNDASLIVSSQSATGTQAPSSAQVTELYGAVFGRLPDVGGLAYYEQTAAKNPGIGFLTYAEWFLSSPEYTGNAAHAYALNATGDAQFITDSYANLLGRAPEAGAVQWYETNVINPIIQADIAAGQTMAQAEIQTHAQVLVYFSQSAEFLNDVSTTGTGTPAFGGHHWLLLV